MQDAQGGGVRMRRGREFPAPALLRLNEGQETSFEHRLESLHAQHHRSCTSQLHGLVCVHMHIQETSDRGLESVLVQSRAQLRHCHLPHLASPKDQDSNKN